MRFRIMAAVALLAGTALVVGVVSRARPAAAVGVSTPVLETRLVGHSVQGRPIIAYHLGKPGIHPIQVIVGQMHGDEHAGVTLTQSIIHARRSIEDINLWVIPTMNPDGDAAHTRQNAHGVDLNRNWPDNWVHLDPPYYSGSAPLSEPESLAMWKFLGSLKPDYLVVLHQPLFGVDTTDGSYLDPAFRDALARNLDLPKKAFLCGGVCHGSMTGWYTTHKLGVDETIEFGSSPTTSYLTGQARDGIVSAMGGHWGYLAGHNPHRYLALYPHAGSYGVLGWVFDPDVPAMSIPYSIFQDGKRIAHHVTARPSPIVNARYHITGTHRYQQEIVASPGKHTICLVYQNFGAGTGYPSTCQTVDVR